MYMYLTSTDNEVLTINGVLCDILCNCYGNFFLTEKVRFAVLIYVGTDQKKVNCYQLCGGALETAACNIPG